MTREPPPPDPVALRLAAACEIVRAAGHLARDEISRPERPEARLKAPADWWSAADGRVEAFIRAQLRALFPDDRFLGEEGGGTLAGNIWVVDPVDGTGNYLRGLPLWCIALAYAVDGEAQIGCVFHPASDELFTARRGGGARLGSQPMRVSGTRDPRRAIVEIGWCAPHAFPPWHAAVGTVVAAGAEFARIGSGALALAWVACGRLDGYCDGDTKAWDGLAGWLLVREAGGVVSDYEAGLAADLSNPIMACTPGLEPTIRECLRCLTGGTAATIAGNSGA